MASFQIVTAKGHRYLRIVESFRDPVTGRPKLRVLRHLGRADDALRTFAQAEHVELASHTHGAVAAVWQMAQTLDLVALIDAHVPAGAARHDGLTVGQSLTLAVVGRACHATSKRGFAPWATTTTLGELAAVESHAPHQPALLGSDAPRPSRRVSGDRDGTRGSGTRALHAPRGHRALRCHQLLHLSRHHQCAGRAAGARPQQAEAPRSPASGRRALLRARTRGRAGDPPLPSGLWRRARRRARLCGRAAAAARAVRRTRWQPGRDHAGL